MSAKDREPQRESAQRPAGQPAGGERQQTGAGGGGGQYGEGNYKATRDYNRGLEEHLRTHDVEREARDAAPRSDEEARQMRQAEEAGKSKARDGGGKRESGESPVK